MNASRKHVLAIVIGALITGAPLSVAGGVSQGESPSDASKATAERKIDINTASLEELITLPEIGKARAQRIIDYRLHVGPFRRIEELVVIRGISRRIFEKIRHLVTISEAQPSDDPDAS